MKNLLLLLLAWVAIQPPYLKAEEDKIQEEEARPSRQILDCQNLGSINIDITEDPEIQKKISTCLGPRESQDEKPRS